MPAWTPAAVAELRRMVAAGLTDFAIAREIGHGAKGVEGKRRRLGIRKHGRVRVRVLTLLAAGWQVWRVAEAVGRGEEWVRQIRRAAG